MNASNIFVANEKLDYDHFFEVFAFTKSFRHWVYEDEWRYMYRDFQEPGTGLALTTNPLSQKNLRLCT